MDDKSAATAPRDCFFCTDKNIGIRTISLEQPLSWIERGRKDYKANFLVSSFYGLIFASFYVALLFMLPQQPFLIMGLVTGFLLVSPFLCLVFYQLSKSTEENEKRNFSFSLKSLCCNSYGISLQTILLGIIMIAWIRLSTLIVGIFFSNSVMFSTEDPFYINMFLVENSFIFMALYMGVGFLVAMFVFSISVVSFPMLLDKNVDNITAIITSVKVTMQNKQALFGWGVLIAFLAFLGFATFGLALIPLIPILGHASWHAYKDLIEYHDLKS